MSKSALNKILGPLCVPLLLASGCSETTSSSDEDALNEHASITELGLESDELYLLHPVRVSVEAKLHGDAYDADLSIGMRTTDRDIGCVLGAMPLQHGGDQINAEGEVVASVSTLEGEFVIGLECAELAGRDDVELFASFDPWNELGERDGWQPPDTDDPTNIDFYGFVAAAALSPEGCDSCETTYALGRNPGVDTQMLEMNVDTVVATVSDDLSTSDDSAFTVTTRSQMRGLGKGKSGPPGPVSIVHRLRPAGSSDPGLALTQRRGPLVETEHAFEVPGDGDQVIVSPLFIEGQLHDALTDGAWSEIEEFELVSCVETEFEQAIYPGEVGPRDNDCGVVEAVVVRDQGLEPYANTNSMREADVWTDTLSAGSSYGFGTSEITLEAWLDVNGSTGAATTYKGIEVASAGSWFEAGFYTGATVFDNDPIDIVDIYATFIAYDYGGGGVAMGAEAFGYAFVPEFDIQLADGISLSLQEMFDAANLDIDPTYTTTVTLVGINFNDGCGSVDAGIWLDGTIGIDTEETTITAATTSQGVEVTGVVTPFFDVTASAGASVNYADFISGSITASLTLLNLALPFEVSVEVIDYDLLSAQRLQFNEYASAVLTSLSGNIKFSFTFKFLVFFEDDHSHTIATWDGYSWAVDFFDENQNVNLGDDKPGGSWCTPSDRQMFDGDFNGDGQGDWLCHNPDSGWNWIDYGPSFGGTNWSPNFGWCKGDDRQMLIGDFNGDGRDDFFCRSSGTQWIDYANGQGRFGGTNWSRSASWCTSSDETIKADDYDNDGRDDLFCHNKQTGTLSLDYADPMGHFMGTDWSGSELP